MLRGRNAVRNAGSAMFVARVGPHNYRSATTDMQYLVIETFMQGPAPVYSRFRERGRMAPDGLTYISSVVTEDGTRCYQIMECDDRQLLQEWMRNWDDIVRFDVIPVISSSEAAARFG